MFALPSISHASGIDRLEMKSATFHLRRDASGHANWQLSDPDETRGQGLPIIRSLSVIDAHVVLDDARRHLRFDGMVTAADANGPLASPPLTIKGAGELNGRTAEFEITGDGLAGASHEHPYHFSFEEHSSGTRLTGKGFLLRPFNFDALDTTFDAVGANLKDLYFFDRGDIGQHRQLPSFRQTGA